uniref:hypothetical protein n=1 Tax=Dulcicalothrix desertica TaxID=32056 RepID=UPI001644EAF6|nr:hypothetical protein [Dulcicalothrix desertica]
MQKLLQQMTVAEIFFCGNHSNACRYMRDHNLVPQMLEKSQFNWRLLDYFKLAPSKHLYW